MKHFLEPDSVPSNEIMYTCSAKLISTVQSNLKAIQILQCYIQNDLFMFLLLFEIHSTQLLVSDAEQL